MGETRSLKVRYTLPALGDLEVILEYIANRSPQGARRVQHRIEALIKLLAERPFLGKRTKDPTIRRLITPPYPYLIFYEIDGNELVIHAIRHTARNPATMPGAKYP